MEGLFSLISLIILCSTWSILIVDNFEPFRHIKELIGLGKKRKLVSDNKIIDYFIYILHKILNCSSCFSCYLLFFTYLIVNGSFMGLLFCPLVYFTTFILVNYVFVIKF